MEVIMSKFLRTVAAAILSFSISAYGQGNAFKVRYNGGSVESSVKPNDWKNTLSVSSDAITLKLKDGKIEIINPKRVTGLSYGQEAHRRVGIMIALGIIFAPLALIGLIHKTRLHYIGIEYTTTDDKKGAVLLQGDKGTYKGILLGLRGVTGIPLAVSDEDKKYVPAGIETISAKSSTGKQEEIKK
jgi:hypothetical protein